MEKFAYGYNHETRDHPTGAPYTEDGGEKTLLRLDTHMLPHLSTCDRDRAGRESKDDKLLLVLKSCLGWVHAERNWILC